MNTGMYISELPCHMILQIFSYVDKLTMIASVRKVCHSFYCLSFDRSLWKTLTMRQFPRTVFTTQSFHKLLTSTSDSIQCLHLDMNKLDDNGMFHEGITCSNVNRFYIYTTYGGTSRAREECANRIGVREFDEMVEDSVEWEHIISLKEYLSNFGKRYPNLKALHLLSGGLDIGFLSDKFLKLETFDLTDGILLESCKEFFENHPSLKHLSLKRCMLESSAVSTVVSQLPSLETFDFSDTTDSFRIWDNGSIVIKHEQPCGLRELYIDDRGDDFLSQFCNIIPELRLLSIKGTQVKDEVLIDVVKHCPKLESILINEWLFSECPITNNTLCAIAASCKNLLFLKLNFCLKTDNVGGIQHIIESCHNLQELELTGCTALTDDNMVALVENCQNIQRLCLGNCVGLTSKSISAILIGCRNLTGLDLEECLSVKCIRISTDSTTKITSNRDDAENETNGELEKYTIKQDTKTKNYKQPIKVHSHLKKLNMQLCYNLTEKCLEQISSFCPDLRDINLCYCSCITYEVVSTLVQNCRLLEKLNLASGSRSDFYILKKLNLSYGSMFDSYKLSDKCLLSISKYCTNLKTLIMTLNSHITADGVFEVIQNCPRIELIKANFEDRFSLDMDKLSKLVGNITGKTVHIDNKSSPWHSPWHNNNLTVHIK